MNKLKNVFYNKKVLITGFNGFKGTWLSLCLYLMGAKLYGISLKSKEKNNHFNLLKKKIFIKKRYFDIESNIKTVNFINDIKPDFVFHLAAQSLVFKSIKDPVFNWRTNVMGFLNIMIGLNKLRKRCVAVLITSDKCYKNLNKKFLYKENDILGGIDPYSASKASSEILFKSFYETYLKSKNKLLTVCTARAGNVIGGGDWSEKRLIPDIMKCWLSNKVISIRNPNATRPWQHVLEAVFGYLILASEMKKNSKLNGESFNFSSNKIKNVSVLKFIKKIQNKNLKIKWRIFKNNKFYESRLLQLNNKKAMKVLNWSSKLTLDETVTLVVEWYKQFKSDRKKIFDISKKQINFYFKKIN